VFSGDVDAIVPVIGSRRWVAALGRPVLAPWKAWTSSTKQVGGGLGAWCFTEFLKHHPLTD
jgi:serine carboxypeptidase-like clade II